MQYIKDGPFEEIGRWAAAAGGGFVGENEADKVAMISSAVV